MDLVSSNARRVVFAAPVDDSATYFQRRALSRYVWFIVALMVGALLFGFSSSWSFYLMLFMAFMLAVLTGYGLWSGKHGTAASGSLVIDLRAGEITFPSSMRVSGAHRVEDVDLLVLPGDEDGESNASTRDWWVMVKIPMSESRDRNAWAEATLYGPGFKGEMELAHQEIEKLVPWGNARRM
ncbi:hypothetical protein BH09SUM1_BH09SUM1_25510 [soil metagenome]